jgi:hypothetical protein
VSGLFARGQRRGAVSAREGQCRGTGGLGKEFLGN